MDDRTTSGPDGLDDILDGEDHDTDRLPDHELRDEPTVGAGVLGMGGTTVDRGTGELGGTAQGGDDGDERIREDDDPALGLDDELDGGRAMQPRTG